MLLLVIYWALLIGGLAAMLLDGGGLIAFAAYFLWMPLGAIGVWTARGQSFAAIGFQPYPAMLRHVILGMASAALIVMLLFGTLWIAGWATLEDLPSGVARIIAFIIAQQIIVACFEEIAFRGVIQQTATSTLGPVRGLGIASVLFGLFHIPNLLYQKVPFDLMLISISALIIMGLVFGSAFQRSNRHLALPIALHFGWNAITYTLEDGLSLSLSGPRWFTGTQAWFPESGLLGMVGLSVLGIVVWVLTRPRSTSMTTP